MAEPKSDSSEWLLYGSIGLGLAAGGLLIAYLLARRNDDRRLPPLNRAEKLIESCEERIAAIQQSVQAVHSHLQGDGNSHSRSGVS